MAESYGKRPLWQLILIYLVVGGVLYALIYYFVLAQRDGGYNTSTPSTTPTPGVTEPITPTAPATPTTPTTPYRP